MVPSECATAGTLWYGLTCKYLRAVKDPLLHDCSKALASCNPSCMLGLYHITSHMMTVSNNLHTHAVEAQSNTPWPLLLLLLLHHWQRLPHHWGRRMR